MYTDTSLTSAASAPLAFGTTTRLIPLFAACNTAGSTPRTGRRLPSSASSPRKSVFSSGSTGACCLAATSPSATARSKAEPCFFDVGRSEVDCHLPLELAEPTVDESGSNPHLSLAHRGIRKPNHAELGDPARHVHLDVDHEPLDTVNRACVRLYQH